MISPSESQVMDALWERGPMGAEEIIATVGPANSWGEATVRTLIFRLQRKKAITGFKEGGRYLYRPELTRETYVQGESQGLLDRLFGGQLTPLLTHFARHRDMTPEELDQLKALIEEMERKNG